MKTTSKIKTAVLALALLFISAGTNAQIGVAFSFNNQLNCAVKIKWEAFDTPGASCNTLCASGIITIPAHLVQQVVSFPGCTNPDEACDLRITVLTIGGTAVTITPFYANSGPAGPISLPIVTGCTNAGSVYDYDQSSCNFH